MECRLLLIAALAGSWAQPTQGLESERAIYGQWVDSDLIAVDQHGVSVDASRVIWETDPFASLADAGPGGAAVVHTGWLRTDAKDEGGDTLPADRDAVALATDQKISFFVSGSKSINYDQELLIEFYVTNPVLPMFRQLKVDDSIAGSVHIIPAGTFLNNVSSIRFKVKFSRDEGAPSSKLITLKFKTCKKDFSCLPDKCVPECPEDQWDVTERTDEVVNIVDVKCDPEGICGNHGKCLPPYGCICNADVVLGYWDPASQCTKCAQHYGGDLCTTPCPRFFGEVCGGHGTCSTDGEPGWAVICKCYNTTELGFWDPAKDCADCLDGFYGFKCDKKCVNCDGGQCYDKAGGKSAREGTQCMCGNKVGENCGKCAPGLWGDQCENKCPGESHPDGCSGRGDCNRETGACMCSDASYGGPDCSLKCPCPSTSGTCSNGPKGTGVCTCNAGFEGPYCAPICNCNGHGRCVGSDNKCLCYDGYFGDFCEKACKTGSQPFAACSGKGTCTTSGGCDCSEGWASDSMCTKCSPGYSGYNCKKCPVSNHMPCGGSMCVDGKCRCVAGTCGEACESDKCTCTIPGEFLQDTGCSRINTPCSSAGGIISDGDSGDGTCLCRENYRGVDCSIVCPEHGGMVCAGNGMCDPNGRCTCFTTTSGTYAYGSKCELICPCAELVLADMNSKLFYSRGLPRFDNDGLSCTCDCAGTGYVGPDCTSPCPGIYSSTRGACSGKGTCVWDGSAARCNCMSAWQGDVCSECATGHFGNNCEYQCINGNQEVNSTGVPYCVCHAGYGGDKCNSTCPGSSNGEVCSGKGTCENTGWKKTSFCKCDAGFKGVDCSKKCQTCPQPKQGERAMVCNDNTKEGECDCPYSEVDGVPKFKSIFSTGKTSCTTCADGYFGADCTEPCQCHGRGACTSTGLCVCNANPDHHFQGATCTECNERYVGKDCSIYNNRLKGITVTSGNRLQGSSVSVHDLKAGTTSLAAHSLPNDLAPRNDRHTLYIGGLSDSSEAQGRVVAVNLVRDAERCPFTLCGAKSRLVHMWVEKDTAVSYLYAVLNGCHESGTGSPQASLVRVPTLSATTTCADISSKITEKLLTESTVYSASEDSVNNVLYAVLAESTTRCKLLTIKYKNPTELDNMCDVTKDPPTCKRDFIVKDMAATWVAYHTNMVFLAGKQVTAKGTVPGISIYNVAGLSDDPVLKLNIKIGKDQCTTCHINRITFEQYGDSLRFYVAYETGGTAELQRIDVDSISGSPTVWKSEPYELGGQGATTTAITFDDYTQDVNVAAHAPDPNKPLGVTTLFRFRSPREPNMPLARRGETTQSEMVLDMLPYNASRLMYTLTAETVTLADMQQAAFGMFPMYYMYDLVPRGITGDAVVGIVGAGFSRSTLHPDLNPSASIGGKFTSVDIINSTFIVVRVKASAGSEGCTGDDVELTMGYREAFTSDGLILHRLVLPQVAKMEPHYVREFTSNTVTIKGSGFENTEFLACRFETGDEKNGHYSSAPGITKYWHQQDGEGGDPWVYENKPLLRDSAVFVDSNEIKCIAPNASRERGFHKVEVTLDGQTFTNHNLSFAIVGKPAKLKIFLTENGGEAQLPLMTRLSPVITLPVISIQTTDDKGKDVGADSNETIGVSVNITHIPQGNGQDYNYSSSDLTKCLTPTVTCTPPEWYTNTLPPAERKGNVQGRSYAQDVLVNRGIANITDAKVACLHIGILRIEAAGNPPYENLEKDVRDVQLDAGLLYKLVFKRGSELACYRNISGSVDQLAGRVSSVVLLPADASGNVLTKKRLDELNVGEQRVDITVTGAEASTTESGELLNRHLNNEVKLQVTLNKGNEWDVLFNVTHGNPHDGHSIKLETSVTTRANCQDDKYYKPSVGCLPCPSHAVCKASTFNGKPYYVSPAEGYWAPEGSNNMQKCPSPSCVGGSPAGAAELCQKGSHGPLCGLCEEDYAKSQSQAGCAECTTSVMGRLLTGVVIVGGFVGFAAYSFITLRQGVASQKGIVVRMLFSHVQVLSALRSLNIPWDTATSFGQWQGFLDFSHGSNLNPGAFQELSCALDPFGRYILTMTMPSVFVPVSIALWLGSRAYALCVGDGDRGADGDDWIAAEEERLRKREELRKRNLLENKISDYAFLEIVIVVGVIVVFILYQMLAMQSSAIISCTSVDYTTTNVSETAGEPSTVEYMTEDMSVTCDSAEYTRVRAIATMFLLTYGLLVPLGLCIAVVRYRKTHSEQSTQMVFTFLIGGFKSRWLKFWQCVIMLRKLCVVLALAFVQQDSNESRTKHTQRTRVYVVIWVLTIFLMMQVKWKPYISMEHNRLEAVALISLLLTLNMGLLFYFHPSFNQDEPFVTSQTFFDVLLVVILVLNIGVMIYFGYVFLNAFKADTKARLGVAEDADLVKALKEKVMSSVEKMAQSKDEHEVLGADDDMASTAVSDPGEPEDNMSPMQKLEESRLEREAHELNVARKLRQEKKMLEQMEKASQLAQQTVTVELDQEVPGSTKLYLHKEKPTPDNPGRVVFKKRMAHIIHPGTTDEEMNIVDSGDSALCIRMSDVVDCTQTWGDRSELGTTVGSVKEDDEDTTFRINAIGSDGRRKTHTFTADSAQTVMTWVAYISRRSRDLRAMHPKFADSDDDLVPLGASQGGEEVTATLTTGFSAPCPQEDPLLEMIEMPLRPVVQKLDEQRVKV